MRATLEAGTSDPTKRSRDGAAATRTRFTPVDAARVAVDTPAIVLTPSQVRVVVAAAALWSRHLQFPTARALSSELGRASPSTVLFGFRNLVDVQAAVIALEWSRLQHAAGSAAPQDGVAWLVRHAEELVAVDRACLRLPALVWASVASAGRPDAFVGLDDLSMPVHALAAFADRPAVLGLRDLHRVLLAASSVWADAERLAVPA